jgi:hypothetical protein
VTRVSIRRFDVVRAANIAALLYVVIILIGMAIFVPFALLAGIAGSQYADSDMGAVMGAGVVGILLGGLFLAVVYGVMGWIMTAIAVALFNFVAGRLGGLQADVVIESPLPYHGAPMPYGAPVAPYAATGYPGAPGGPPSPGGPAAPPPPGWGRQG